MGIFSGPSSSILQKIALGYVTAVMEHKNIVNSPDLSNEEKIELLNKAGLPNHRDHLTVFVVEEVSRLGLGWLKRNQFIDMIQGHASNLGFSKTDSNYLKEAVEMAFAAYEQARKGF